MKISCRNIILIIFCICLLSQDIIINCERMETIASFKSNFQLKKKGGTLNKKVKEPPQEQIPTFSADPQNPLIHPALNKSGEEPEDSAMTLIKKSGDDLPDVPIYHQGWVKYFRYTDNGKERPKMFFKNSAFEKQQRYPSKEQTTDKDQYGSVKIPSEKYFFMVIYKDTANLLTSRENPLMQIADSLIIDFIKTIPEDNNYMGGIKDFGRFSEGSCFEVTTVKPGAFFQMSTEETHPSSGLTERWLICSDDDTNKKLIMDILIKLKLKKQHALGVYISTPADPLRKNNLNSKNNQPTLSDVINNNPNANDPDKINDPERSLSDGYWVILQNWSQCTLKCGGGLEYLHLMCVPPKKGGKMCQGEPIRTRPCNMQPCPKIDVIKTLLPQNNNSTNVVEKPIVKMLPISNRPQRYDKCYLKDTDALMVKTDVASNSDTLPKIPIRLVMNNKSVSVYQDDKLQTNLMTFILSNTKFSRIRDQPRCFLLTGLHNKSQFCQIDSDAGNFVEEWDYDFNLFKYQCRQKRETVELQSNEEQALAKDYQDKLNSLKQEMVEKKAEEIKKKVEDNEEIKLQKKVEQTQSMTLMAVQKELKLEEMLEKEEEQKELEEQEQLRAQIEAEKKKNDCLTKSINEKQREDQMNLTKANAEDAIQGLKEEAKKEILYKRQEIKKKLENMRKKNRRKLTQMQNEILNLRVETANKVQKYAKAGDLKKCFNPGAIAGAASSRIEEYCQVEFQENYSKLLECKSPDTFCYVCCENEFGDMHMKDRENCYKTICEDDKTATATLVTETRTVS